MNDVQPRNQVHGRTAIEQRIEFHEPNMGLAYAALAPLVSEALAYYEAGDSERGIGALREARKVIHMAGAMMGTISIATPS